MPTNGGLDFHSTIAHQSAEIMISERSVLEANMYAEVESVKQSLEQPIEGEDAAASGGMAESRFHSRPSWSRSAVRV